MVMRVNPNRMELLKLRKRMAVAKRGHKLLKDKFDELMKQFLSLIQKDRSLREQIEEALKSAFGLFAIARSEAPIETIEEALIYPCIKVDINVVRESLMNVAIPRFELEQEGDFDCYGLAITPCLLDDALGAFEEVLPLMIELAELEKRIELLAYEIERTRRRVNALEYVLVPQLEETITFITMKLDEMERADRTRIMKIKEMVSESAV